MRGHTPGPWAILAFKDYDKDIRIESPYYPVCRVENDDIEHKQAIANARLIAEAGTVAHETGMTPRQLAEQRSELLEALKCANDGTKLYAEHPGLYAGIIAKAEGKE